MIKLLLGTAFMLLSYDRNIGAGTVELVPHFIGYMLALWGARDMISTSRMFEKVYIPSYIMVVYSLVYFILKAGGVMAKINSWNPYVNYIIDLLSSIGALVVVFKIIFAITNVEYKKHSDIGAKRLQLFWKVLSISYLIYYVMFMSVIVQPDDSKVKPLLLMAFLGFNALKSLVVIIFLFMMYRTWGMYMEKASR